MNFDLCCNKKALFRSFFVKGKKIVSLGLALFGAVSPLNCSRIFASGPYVNSTSIQTNVDTKIEDLEVNNLLIEKFGKCKREN